MLLNVELNEALYIYRLDYPVALITFLLLLEKMIRVDFELLFDRFKYMAFLQDTTIG